MPSTVLSAFSRVVSFKNNHHTVRFFPIWKTTERLTFMYCLDTALLSLSWPPCPPKYSHTFTLAVLIPSAHSYTNFNQAVTSTTLPKQISRSPMTTPLLNTVLNSQSASFLTLQHWTLWIRATFQTVRLRPTPGLHEASVWIRKSRNSGQMQLREHPAHEHREGSPFAWRLDTVHRLYNGTGQCAVIGWGGAIG